MDWNRESDLCHSPYSFSKTEAEKAAWKWMDDNKTKISFDIITILPSLVIGKHYNDKLKVLNESNDVFGKLINGVFPVIMNISFTIVDVRDVADAHIFMIENKNAIKTGLYIEYVSIEQLIC